MSYSPGACRKDEHPVHGERMNAEALCFKSCDSALTTGEMAAAMATSQTQLRYLERTGKVPKANRDASGKMM